MALWAMGDFHLAFSVDKPMEVFDPIWKNHEKKIQKYVTKCVKDTDTIVITGDHSWGRNLEECETDLKFIEELPGRKILLRGNHDMFWDAKKTARLNDSFEGRLQFLQNNYYNYGDYALVGTKGYCYEGKDSIEHFPPTTIGEQESPFTQIAEEYGAEQVIYSHCHGRERYDDSFKGEVNGIMYRLDSSDYLKFRPERIL